MVFQGSKSRLAKYIVPIIQKYIDDNNIKEFYDPFCGGCNIIDKIKCESRFASDLNPYLIALLKYVKHDPNLSIAPDECPFEHYTQVRTSYRKNDNKYSMHYIALIGYCASYGGRFFDGGYGRDARGGRSIYNERLNNLRQQAPSLQDITFSCNNYKDYNPKNYNNCCFYIDGPYKDTKAYSGQSINYDEFYDWCRALSKNNIVIISEYHMPEDFTCIWSKPRAVLQKSTREFADRAIEKLFIYKGE